MDKSICKIAEQINKLNQKACKVYAPLVEDVCSRTFLEATVIKML